ncbi:MAG: Do family serine endopeptidase [Planctomycetales bacterium]
MNMIRRNGQWIVALVGILSLAFSAGVMAQKQPAATIDPAVAKGLAEANELSSAFRHASRDSLPAMVSIETKGKVAQVSGLGQGGDELLEGTPFGDMFRGDPRLRDMFRRRQREMPRSHGMGSGFIIDSSGIILTANHVVADAEQVKVKLHDGREYLATDVKTDPKTDIAVVRIKAEGSLPVLPLGNSDTTEIGDWVLAIGSPFGLDATVTAGIISAKGRGPKINEREDFLQTDAAINPGNSGGPLINLHGEVVGINTAISTRSGGYDGVGFAIPINLARWVVDQLVARGEVTRAYLGVAIQEVDSDLSKQFGVPVGKGAVVTQVMSGSPAAQAQLEPGDLILKFNGREVRGSRDLQSIVERMQAGSSYPMQIVRDGKEMTIQVQVQAMPKDYSLVRDTVSPGRGPVEKPRSDTIAELGIDIESASRDVLQQLGYQPDVSGVLISSVKEESVAANAGLREGMVIEKVGSQRVSGPAEFKAALGGLSLEKGILFLVRTPRGTQFVVVRKEAT